MKKNNVKRINLKQSIILLLLLIVFLIASTYAWFTSNQTVTVSSLNVNVEAKNGLQISVDGTNWKSLISTTDITGVSSTYATNKNQLPTILEPVSTIGNIDATTGFMKMFYGTVGTNDVTGEYTLTAAQSTEVRGVAGKFIAFDLFLRVTKDTPMFLSPSSKVTFGDATSKGMENAARIALVNEGNVAVGSTTGVIQALKGATDATKYIYEPNYDVHSSPAVANAYDFYGITTTNTGGALLPYAGIKADIVELDAVELKKANTTLHPTLFGNVVPEYKSIAGFTSKLPMFELKAGITKVRVYMWVEGQDIDCENVASGSNIKFDLQFTSNGD